MACSPLPRARVKTMVPLGALLGPLLLAGCGNPGEGTIQTAPSARHRTADPVSKVRAGVRSWEAKGPSAIPGEPGKLGPARGRRGD
jgi:hypothetical protein